MRHSGTDEVGWFAVYTSPRCERTAAGSIEELGFKVFSPTVEVWVSHARRRQKVERPLLSRYIFASFDLGDDRWPLICHAEGVEAILSTVTVNEDGDVFRFPVAIPTKQMAMLFDWQLHPGIIEACKAGDIMRIVAGPMAGHLTTITEVRMESYTAVADVTLFGAVRSTQFDIDNLERP